MGPTIDTARVAFAPDPHHFLPSKEWAEHLLPPNGVNSQKIGSVKTGRKPRGATMTTSSPLRFGTAPALSLSRTASRTCRGR